LSVGRCCTNYAGGNIFPYEYRKWAKLKEIIFKKPQGFDVTNGSFRQYRTRGTGRSTNQFISSISPYSQTSNEVKYRTDSLYTDVGGTILISDDGFHGTYTASLTPNCKASNTTHDFIYGFVFEKLGYLGSGVDTIMTSNTRDIVTFTRQDMNITVTDDYVFPEKDTVEWEIRVKNLNTQALAKNVWLGALTNSNRKIVAIKDKATNQFLPNNNDIFMAGDFSGGVQKDYIIYATYSSCNKDSLQLCIGSNCSSYPTSILSYPCDFKTYNLKYEPINTRLDATILTRYSEIDLCKNKEFQVQINNTGSPKVYNSYIDIQTQPGMTIEDTAWLYKDGRSDSICIQNFTRVGPSVYRWDFSNRDSLFDKNGINGVNSKSGYKLIFKFRLSTDCNYTSGSSFLLRTGGFLKCGNAVNAPFILSDPINIKGVVKPYFSSISFHMNPLVPCNYNDSTYAKFINLGPDSTGQSDQFILSLPPGVFVDTNYIDKGHNAPTQKPTLDNSTGQNIYSWKIPPYIVPGDSSIFRIKTFLDNFNLTCGIRQTYAQAVVKSSALCVSSGTYCDINVATSSIQRADSVIKETYALKFLNATSIPNGTDELISLNYTLKNTGIDKTLSSPLITQIIYDSNKNGSVDSGDIYITQDTLFNKILSGEEVGRNLKFKVPSIYTCDLLLYLSDSNCVCNSLVDAISNIQLLNAGNDTIICSDEQIIIGSKGDTSHSYQWNNASFLNDSKVSNPKLTIINKQAKRLEIPMILTTNKGNCSSSDTAIITVFAGMEIDMLDTVSICQGERIPIGYFVTGGESKLKQTSWYPADSLSSSKGFFTYASPITNTLYTLTVTDLEGCKIKDSTMVQVINKPIANIGLQDNCASSLFSFENKTDYQNSQRDSISWDLGILGLSNFNNPKYYIDSAQQIKAMLYVNNTYGCWDTTSSVLNVHPNPKTSFHFEGGCEEDTALFIDRSVLLHGKIINKWSINNEEFDTDTVHKKLPQKDSIWVTLKSYSDQGCTDSSAQWVSIYDKPEISLNLNNHCQNEQIVFDPQFKSIVRDSIISYNWDLGDQTISSKKTLSHQYVDTGTFQVNLKVITSNQCIDTAIASVRVYSLPKSSFTVQNSCKNDNAWAYSNSSITTGKITDLYWDIDGNGFISGTDSIRLNTSLIGEQFLRQKVISDKGCIDSTYDSYSVNFRETINHIQQGVCENENIIFISQPTQSDSVSETTWIIQNDTLIGETISYRFPGDGIYSLNQKIRTNRGCESDSNYTITIRPEPFTSILLSQPCDDNLVEFKSSANNDIYEWNLSDGTNQDKQQFLHSFLDTGKYTVILKVSNEFGCSYLTNDSVDITHIVKPDLSIQDRCENELGWVYNRTQGNLQPVSKAIFEMGDGNSIEKLDSFEYLYAISGNYPVNLKITTLPGCEYSISKNVTIHPLPTADFKLNPETADIFSSEIMGTDQSLGSDSIYYYISDGTIYSTPNFEHTFSDSGAYSIKQWVISPFGCMDSLTKTLYISYAYNLHIPNAFTPTNDGLNDGFKPIGLGVKSYEMTIYNRWGEKIFISNKDQSSWDGKDAIPGYYLYHIKAKDFRGNIHYYKGSVYLIK
jgi:gliding motility-associated-like protein